MALKRIALAQCDPLRCQPAEEALQGAVHSPHMAAHQAAVLEVGVRPGGCVCVRVCMCMWADGEGQGL